MGIFVTFCFSNDTEPLSAFSWRVTEYNEITTKILLKGNVMVNRPKFRTVDHIRCQKISDGNLDC